MTFILFLVVIFTNPTKIYEISISKQKR